MPGSPRSFYERGIEPLYALDSFGNVLDEITILNALEWRFGIWGIGIGTRYMIHGIAYGWHRCP